MNTPTALIVGAGAALLAVGGVVVGMVSAAEPHHAPAAACRIELYSGGVWDAICPGGAKQPGPLSKWPIIFVR